MNDIGNGGSKSQHYKYRESKQRNSQQSEENTNFKFMNTSNVKASFKLSIDPDFKCPQRQNSSNGLPFGPLTITEMHASEPKVEKIVNYEFESCITNSQSIVSKSFDTKLSTRHDVKEFMATTKEQNKMEFLKSTTAASNDEHKPALNVGNRDKISNNDSSTEESVKDIKTESFICSSNIFGPKDYSGKSGFTYERKCEERRIQNLSREDFKTCDNTVNICSNNFKHFISLNDVQEVTSPLGRSAKAFGHSHDKRFVCPFCGKGFHDKYSFEVHYRNSIGEKPYICDICGKGFAAKNILTRHLVHHSEEKPFACDSCEKRYNKKGNLTRHLRSHTGEKPYKCFLCAKAFIYCGDRKRHCKNVHGIKLARNICRVNMEL